MIKSMIRTTRVLTPAQFDYLKQEYKAPELMYPFLCEMKNKLLQDEIISVKDSPSILFRREGGRYTKALVFLPQVDGTQTLVAHFGFGMEDPLSLELLERMYFEQEEMQINIAASDGVSWVWIYGLIASVALCGLWAVSQEWILRGYATSGYAVLCLIILLAIGAAAYKRSVYKVKVQKMTNVMRDSKLVFHRTFASI